MKFVSRLTAEVKLTLREAQNHHFSSRVRQRAHAIQLSNKSYTLSQLAGVFDVRRNTVSQWINDWEALGVVGLFDKPRSGRPALLSDDEIERFRQYIDENPHQPKSALSRLETETGKTASDDTYKRCLKKMLYRWKRLRTSSKELRDEETFRKDQEVMCFLQAKEEAGDIVLRYFDEAGFSLTPSVPYGWQAIGQTQRIPCQRSKRQNVLGFMGRQGEWFYRVTEQTVTTETVIEVFDEFSQAYYDDEFSRHGKLCFVAIDNASMHTSAAFRARMEDWLLRGVIPRYLPTYSPELNLIEILWRKIKYEWLPLKAFRDSLHFKYWLNKILEAIGDEYQIAFS